MAATLQLVIKAIDQASGTLLHVDKTAGGLSKTLGNTLKAGALAGVAALGTLAFAGVKFIGAASNLEESVNKSKVVFGDFSTKVRSFAETSAQSFGVSRNAANSYAATLGTILKGSGLAQGASADMSLELVKLASDMASFNNIPIGEALEKIRAGLVGESEPLRTVGVLLSETAVKEKAYAMGLAETGAVLTDQQKVQARYALILEQTKDTQGDFARTSGNLANQQRILGAEWENIQAILGRALIPTVTRLAQTLTKFLAEHEDEIEQFSRDLERLAEDVMPQVESAAKGMAETLVLIKDAVVPTVKALNDLDQMLGGKLSKTFIDSIPGIREWKTIMDVKTVVDNGKQSIDELAAAARDSNTPIGQTIALMKEGGDVLGIFGGKADDAKDSTDDLTGAADGGTRSMGYFGGKITDASSAAGDLPGDLAPAILSIDDLRTSADEARDALFKMFKEPTKEEAAAEAVLAGYELQLAGIHDKLIPLDDAQRIWLDSLGLTGTAADIAALAAGGLTQAEAEAYLQLKNNLIPEQKDHLDFLGKTRDAAGKEAEAKHNTLPTQEEWRRKVEEQTLTLAGLQGKINEVTGLNFPGLAAGWETQGIMTGRAKQAVEEYQQRLDGLDGREVNTNVRVRFYGTNDLTEAQQRAFSGGAFLPAGRAMGGSVTAGTPYTVGERGIEVFIPRESGSIVPNDALRSAPGGGNAQRVEIHAHYHDHSTINTATPARMDQAARILGPLIRRHM